MNNNEVIGEFYEDLNANQPLNLSNANDPNFFLAVKGNDTILSLYGRIENNLPETIINFIANKNKKENIYLTGIKNLLKTKKFLQLCIEHAENGIDDEEFEREIKTNRDEYVIQMRSLSDIEELDILTEIAHRISNKITIDEVSEIFSISSNSIVNARKSSHLKK